MSPILTGGLFSIVVFAGLCVSMELGRRLRHRHTSAGEPAMALGTVESATFGLMALILAFAFNGAASRFDTRRHLLVAEVNAISSAYNRLDLLAPDARSALQQKLKQYVDYRIALYRAVPDTRQVSAWNGQAVAVSNEIWRDAVTAVASSPAPTIAAQLLPAIAAMTDAATERGAASFIHPPVIVYVMLGVIALFAASLAGYAMGASEKRSWLHMAGFAVVLSVTIYVIIDLEYPRLGRFRINEFDQMLVDWRKGLSP